MSKLIYVVDDEENIREILSYNLEKNGYNLVFHICSLHHQQHKLILT